MNTVKTRAGSAQLDKDKKTDSPVRMTRRTSTPSCDKKIEDYKLLRNSPMKTRRVSTPVGDKEKPDKKEPKEKTLKVQVTRTPETPRPGSDKQAEKKENGDATVKDTKSPKAKEEATNTGRKLRSADKVTEKENGDHDEGLEGRRETKYSKSRVKVSPYRRPPHSAHDTQNTSTAANYTGNNTTMEMDITETSAISESSNNSGVRGRRSYKSLRPVKFERPPNSTVTVVNTSAGKRLCGTVVGRKRKPEPESPAVPVPEMEPETLPDSLDVSEVPEVPETKRQRRHLLERVLSPFVALSSTPEPRRKNAQIVGINSDIPLSSPVAADPEVIKVAPEVTHNMAANMAADEQPAPQSNKRCVIM